MSGYEAIFKTVCLTSDEKDMLIELLEKESEKCVSIGEEITVNELKEKLEQ